MRIAVTGGSGKLGRTVVRELRKAGDVVVSLDATGERGPGFVRVDVTVYLLKVIDEKRDWRESRSRERAWLKPEQAASLIDEPDLATLVRGLTIPEPEHDKPRPAPG